MRENFTFLSKIVLHFGLFLFPLFAIAQTVVNEIEWTDLEASINRDFTVDDIIVVESGDRLVIRPSDVQKFNETVKGILIYGELEVKDKDVSQSLNKAQMILTADWILAVNGGNFIIGSEQNPFAGNFELVLSGDEGEKFSLEPVINQTANHISTGGEMNGMGNHPQMLHTMIRGDNLVGVAASRHVNNYSFLMAMGEGSKLKIFTIDGKEKKPWTKLSQTLESGQTSITLVKSTNWKVGDRIVIASTDFDLNQAEEFTIIGVENQSKTIHLDKPAEFMHYSGAHNYSNGTNSWRLKMKAEVGLINRNVKIRGDVIYDSNKTLAEQEDQYGGHTMIMMGASMKLFGVEFEYMGQAGKIGRYPAHWHMLGERGRGQSIKHCSFHHTFNKGLTVHGTHHTNVRNNLVYENIGHGYFLEDGGEYGNSFVDNLAINARKPSTQEAATERDDFINASNFWIENNRNMHLRNHAAGSEGHGFFYKTKGLNGLSNSRQHRDQYKIYSYPEGPRDQGRRNRVFFKNIAHTARGFAFGLENNSAYIDANGVKQYTKLDWSINNFIAYKSNIALWVRGVGGDLNNVILADNVEGTLFRLNQSLNNSLIVGRSPNIGNPQLPEEVKEGRSLRWYVRRHGDGSVRDTLYSGFVGHPIYDGPSGLNNIHFVGFTGQDDYAMKGRNAAQKATVHYVNGLTFGNDVPNDRRLYLRGRDRVWVPSRGRYTSHFEVRAFVDIDGSLTSTPGATIIERHDQTSLDVSQGFYHKPEWGEAIVYPNNIFGSMLLRGTKGGLHFENPPSKNTYISYTKYNDQILPDPLPPFHINKNSNNQFVFIPGDLYKYKIELTDAPNSFEFYMNGIPMGKSVVYEIVGLDVNSQLSTRNSAAFGPENRVLQEMNSLTQLNNHAQTAVFRDITNGKLFIKFVAEMYGDWDFPQPRMTYKNVTMGGVNVVVNQPETAPTQQMRAVNLVDNVVTVYPNPVENYFKLNFGTRAEYFEGKTLQLISHTSNSLVRTFKIEDNKAYHVLGLQKGIYYLTIRGNSKWNKKLIIE